jgi:hypothetical protein
MEYYEENLKHYPILVPVDIDAKPELLNHLRFHNGTIWRWNRPLIGFDTNNKPHLRIEHRVIPSGPTVVDSVANAAFYYGLINGLEDEVSSLLEQIPFEQTRDNFYRCAQYGLEADIAWSENSFVKVSELIREKLIPAARHGLKKIEVNADEIEKYIGIIEARATTGQNGATWQRRWVEKHGKDMQQLTCSYMQNQHQGRPVHEWSI